MKKAQLLMALVFMIGSISNIQAQWKSMVSLGGSYYSGNVNRSDIRLEGSATHVDTVFEYSTNFKMMYGENNSVKSNEEYVGILKLDYLPSKRFSPFALVSGFKNIYKGMDLRLTGLLGFKYLIYSKMESPKVSICNYSVSAAIQYDIEDYHTDISKKEITRLSIRPKFQQRIGKSIFLEHLTFLRYNVSDFSDYQIDSRTSFTNQLTKKLFLQLSFDYDYQSRPPSALIKKEDTAIIISLIFKI